MEGKGELVFSLSEYNYEDSAGTIFCSFYSKVMRPFQELEYIFRNWVRHIDWRESLQYNSQYRDSCNVGRERLEIFTQSVSVCRLIRRSELGNREGGPYDDFAQKLQRNCC